MTKSFIYSSPYFDLCLTAIRQKKTARESISFPRCKVVVFSFASLTFMVAQSDLFSRGVFSVRKRTPWYIFASSCDGVRTVVRTLFWSSEVVEVFSTPSHLFRSRGIRNSLPTIAAGWTQTLRHPYCTFDLESQSGDDTIREGWKISSFLFAIAISTDQVRVRYHRN